MSPALQADSLPAKRELSLNGHGGGAWRQRGKGTQEGAGRGQGVSAHTCACVCLPQSVNSTTQFPSLVPSLVYAGVCGREGHKMRLVNRARARQMEGLNI